MRMRRKPWTEPLLDSCPYLIDSPRDRRGQWRSFFAAPDRPLHLEIGCGKGVSTVQMAHDNPGVNLVAIDEVRHVLAVTIKNAAQAYGDDPVNNLLLAAVDAMFITDSFAPEDGVSRIYIQFPNPWNDKAKQHKRRLTHPRQLMQYRSFLSPGGEIYFKTDDVPLFTATKRYLAMCGFELTYQTDDLHASGFAPNYISEHEQFYAGQGIPIHFLIARMGPLPENFCYEVDGHRIDQVDVGAQIRRRKAQQRSQEVEA